MARRGKRRRYQEARDLKRGEIGIRDAGECSECGVDAGAPHQSWCEAELASDDDPTDALEEPRGDREFWRQ